MLRLAEVVQARTPRPLLRALHDLDGSDGRREHLEPHLDADAGEVIAEQHGGGGPAAAHVQAHAGERLAGRRPHQQHVAGARRLRVVAREEPPARARRVEARDLRGLEGAQWFAAGAPVGGRGVEDGDWFVRFAGCGEEALALMGN